MICVLEVLSCGKSLWGGKRKEGNLLNRYAIVLRHGFLYNFLQLDEAKVVVLV